MDDIIFVKNNIFANPYEITFNYNQIINGLFCLIVYV